MIVAIMLTSIGFVTYYFIPYFQSQGDTTMVFIILNMILVLLIIGLTFISTLLFNIVERVLLWLTLNTCCRRDRRFYDVITKNMDGHKQRNNKTSIMFTLAISFMMFSITSFNIMTSISQLLT